MTRSNEVLPSVLAAIGDTPLVELKRITQNLEGRIYAKLEYLNPGFSKKDRNALQMIEDAEVQGVLQPGQTVVELTSGNTGTGLAIVCAVKGYPFVAVMSRGNSKERARMMSAQVQRLFWSTNCQAPCLARSPAETLSWSNGRLSVWLRTQCLPGQPISPAQQRAGSLLAYCP